MALLALLWEARIRLAASVEVLATMYGAAASRATASALWEARRAALHAMLCVRFSAR